LQNIAKETHEDLFITYSTGGLILTSKQRREDFCDRMRNILKKICDKTIKKL